jgi:NAD-reducing hydrogenase small subunit
MPRGGLYHRAGYIRNTTHNIPNDPALPLLLDKVYPCSDVVKIDYKIPGCAPTGDVIFDTLSRLLDGTYSGLRAGNIRFD